MYTNKFSTSKKAIGLEKCIYSIYSPLSSTHTYDFVVLISLTHPRKKFFGVVLQIEKQETVKAKDLSAPLRRSSYLTIYLPKIVM
jgi:hypothetical protein